MWAGRGGVRKGGSIEHRASGIEHRVRPRVVLSRCLEVAACRYDGKGIRSEVVRELAPWVEYVPVCPEVRIGLGVPRAPIRIERSSSGERRLVQPSTGADLTDRMLGFAGSFADETAAVDGVLLKSRSPSCGLGDVKVYEGEEPVTAAGSGLFAAVLVERYPGVAMADEARLLDGGFRHDWLTRVFASARRRAAREAREADVEPGGGVVDFGPDPYPPALRPDG